MGGVAARGGIGSGVSSGGGVAAQAHDRDGVGDAGGADFTSTIGGGGAAGGLRNRSSSAFGFELGRGSGDLTFASAVGAEAGG